MLALSSRVSHTHSISLHLRILKRGFVMTRLITSLEDHLNVQAQVVNDLRELLQIRDDALKNGRLERVTYWANAFAHTFTAIERFITESEKPYTYASDELIASILHVAYVMRQHLYDELFYEASERP